MPNNQQKKVPKDQKNKRWLDYQKNSYEVIKKLFPSSKVEHDIKVVGKLSEGRRQIDVCLDRDNDSIKKVFECKDYSKKAIDTPKIDALFGNLRDIGAEKGAFVSNTPYTKPAKNLASKSNIDLLHLIDSDNPDKVIYLRRFNLGLGSSDTVPNSILESENNGLSLLIGKEEIPIIHLVKYLWEETDSLSRELGNYEYFPPKQTETMFLTEGNDRITLNHLSIIYTVEAKYYLLEVGAEKAKGLHNAQDKSFVSADELLTEKIDISGSLQNTKETDETFNGSKIPMMMRLIAELNVPTI
ncbi:MAG: hypothetical protein Athens101428_742 [Candidatus Berkelbacteria bacterium Athens1014_28]|uniref:Restriction endonuclease type IV Mrr domain-containing protein n=1 Tax=Candidatus Berkelbacteria bacterium Athens1014_28 TaxID=2017145 RepID=A0A554LJQ4_9BACT|nr:MAG: hypothetical protein Athens101428_742 [Candidatus Berkelbacteria bacterium Athens1014_28]